jgi:hypothetical protein
VAHVEIKTPSVEQKTSVTRWFFVVAVMQIDGADLGISEKMVLHLCRPELGINVRLVFAQKTAIFSFNSNDPVH